MTLGISWLEEIQQFYRERSLIEREYATKLAALCKKYSDRKAKKSSVISVGETPSLTPGSLECASLTTWSTQLTAVESYAAARDQFGLELVAKVAEPLRQTALRYDELRRSHVDYFVKLEKERDSSYSDLKKAKGKYDGACQDVENRRKKMESSFEYGKAKAQAAYQQQLLEMNNTKNTYLIGINVTNKLKGKYYQEYVPELLDSLQDLNETRVAKLNTIWSLTAQLETSALVAGTEQMTHLSKEILRNNPQFDSLMFLQHNVTEWQEPADMIFEPSPVWHDDDAIATDEPAKIFLGNLLSKSKEQMKEWKMEADKQRREVEGARRVREKIRLGEDDRDEVELVKVTFTLQEKLNEVDRKRVTAEVETSTIVTVVGDLSLGAKNHNFRSQTFTIPTNCDLCGERIWGLSAKGFDCRDCGYTCHSKCQMKVPADCPGEQTKEEKKKLKVERQEVANVTPVYDHTSPNGATELPTLSRRDTMSSLSSGYAAIAHRSVAMTSSKQPGTENAVELPAPSSPPPKAAPAKRNRILAPPPTQYSSPPPINDSSSALGSSLKQSESKGKMLYSYQASGQGEITVDEGQDVIITDPDDGSGWIHVRAGTRDGLVPASYVEPVPTPSPAPSPTLGLSDRPGSTYSSSSISLPGSVSSKRVGPAVAPKRGAKKLQYVEALYDYEARSDAEWSMAEGDRFVLTSRDGGDGWVEVEKGGQIKSVPANYIQEV